MRKRGKDELSTWVACHNKNAITHSDYLPRRECSRVATLFRTTCRTFSTSVTALIQGKMSSRGMNQVAADGDG